MIKRDEKLNWHANYFKIRQSQNASWLMCKENNRKVTKSRNRNIKQGRLQKDQNDHCINEVDHPSNIISEDYGVGYVVPKSPLEEDSVKLGVPSVQVGVLPSTERGGVHAWPRPCVEETIWLPLLSTPSVERASPLGSSWTSLTLC